MPVQASEVAKNVDHLYLFLLVSSLISFVILIGGMTWFIFKYRRKTDSDKTAYITHNTLAEFLWSFIPLVIMIVIFWWGWRIFADLRKVHDKGDIEIHVTARQWQWTFKYPNGVTIVSPNATEKLNTLFQPNGIYVPVGKTVRLVMTSQDVLHSFYVPAFRNKMDAIPGRYTTLTFTPTEKGDFVVYCTEFCGTSHSNMLSAIRVVDHETFDKWYAEAGNVDLSKIPPTELGKKLYAEKACAGCHSTDGSRLVGPSYKGLFGSTREFESGPGVTADENYIRKSILQPTAQVVKGYPPAMPSYQGQLSDDEINALIEYIKTLK
ncbi:cytochrome c oxidase subunit II [Leptospira kirschneri serovar Pomona]|uniref:Cytochrome c oxidase subunit 2 n=3 Tax=Leptospira kirschneri TaxID=29507 RepID=A0A1T1DGX5_9LEPT|nr:cytochrome c oxidase, subunit II [Leptospira kirschneri serovar Grippotyphosa str. RM52]EKO49914.1 cytochrome c oxidase, subunit II [Leptospira kirschneri str. 200802841]EKP06019.1 cytochrome c oxidase, subunit II [Leptospira kirschneri str. 2008720114]EKR06813.1 cytochrome c oxidase, subunit II [Leptospira kirschneri serovar Valbuzzi str. 200702274]EMK03366.1 cytochrome c oxidase, subunit II [Leptospira kirschneri str. MMD1493]EMN25026.1 cytochrome c oxidase, subunit II [Leptospira kirschn